MWSGRSSSKFKPGTYIRRYAYERIIYSIPMAVYVLTLLLLILRTEQMDLLVQCCTALYGGT